MIFCTQKFRLKRVLKRWLILILVFLLSTWWIYSKCFSSLLQGDKWDEWNEMEWGLRENIEEYKRTKIKTLSNDIEQNEKFPVDIRHFSTSTRKKRKESLLQRYQNDQKNLKDKKEMIQDIMLKKGKRTNIEITLNDIEEKEIYPIDIRHIPASIQRKQEKGQPREYDDEKYVKELKKMLHGNESSRVIQFEDDFLKLFLKSNDYKVDQAYSKLQNFLNLKIDHDYFFYNMTFDFTKNPAYKFVTVLPYRRKDGSTTILFELAKWDPNKVPIEHLKKIFFMLYIQSLRNPVTQESGFNLIYDFEDAGFRYVKYGTPQNLYLLHHVSFETMPVKYVGIHLVNMNVIGNILLTLTRPFIPKYIENIFYTHSSAKELHDFFPTSMLPARYGGELTEYYAANWIRKANEEHGIFPAGGQKNTF